MSVPVINEQERHLLQALLAKGAMTPEQMSELCTNAFGWSSAVIRRTQKSLLQQGLVAEENGLLTPMVTKEDLEDSSWEQKIQDTFEWHSPAQPDKPAKQPFFKSIWFWSTCVACVVIATLWVLFAAGSPVPTPETPATNNAVSIPEELEICKEALDKWQKLDACKILQSFTRYGDRSAVLESAEYVEYWQSGDNWIRITNFGGYSRGQLYRNGNLYQGTSDENVLIWLPEEATLTQQPYVWPISFTWDDCDLIHKTTKKSVYGDETHIIFSVVVTDPEHPLYTSSPYYVCFAFDKNKQLESISVAMVGSDRISNFSVTVSTYRLVSEDADAITQYINNQILPDSQYVPEPG